MSSAGRKVGNILDGLCMTWTFLVAQLVKNPPTRWETWVGSLGWEDPLEKGTATHTSIPAWRIHEPYSPWGCKELDTAEQPPLHYA